MFCMELLFFIQIFLNINLMDISNDNIMYVVLKTIYFTSFYGY